MPDKKTMIYVEDHTSTAESVGGALELKVPLKMVKHYQRADTAYTEMAALPAESQPDLVIIDLRLPGPDGLSLPKKLAASMPRTKWLLLTGHTDGLVVTQALKAGVLGIVSKGVSMDTLVHACRAVLDGREFLCPAFAKAQKDTRTGMDRTADLTEREKQLLGLVAAGYDAQAMAAKLGASVKTIHNQVTSIRNKLGEQEDPNDHSKRKRMTPVALRDFAVNHGLGRETDSTAGGSET